MGVTRQHEYYLQDSLHTVTVNDESPDSPMPRVTITSWLKEYVVLREKNGDRTVTVDIHGDYVYMFGDDFVATVNAPVDTLMELFHEEAVLNGIVYVHGVNQTGRRYTDHKNMKKVNESLLGRKKFLSSVHLDYHDSVTYTVLTNQDAALYNALTDLGLPAAIAFKIMLSLHGVEDTVAFLDSYMQSSPGFQYDEATHMSLFEVYAFFASQFSVGVTENIFGIQNYSMPRLERIWRTLRRGGDTIYDIRLHHTMQALDSRTGSVILVLLERNMLQDQKIANNVLELLQNVDWDTMLISIDDYVQRLYDAGVSEAINKHFRTIPSEAAQRVYVEAYGVIENETSKKTTRSMNSNRATHFPDTMVKVDFPLLGHLTDDETLLHSIEVTHEYYIETIRPQLVAQAAEDDEIVPNKAPIDMLYTHVNWSMKGMEDMPLDWMFGGFMVEDD